MAEIGGRLGFTFEALDKGGIGRELCEHDLYGHRPIKYLIAR